MLSCICRSIGRHFKHSIDMFYEVKHITSNSANDCVFWLTQLTWCVMTWIHYPLFLKINVISNAPTDGSSTVRLKQMLLTEAQPHPDFLAGLTSFLQNMAQELGEPNTSPVSHERILPLASKSAVNFWPWARIKRNYFVSKIKMYMANWRAEHFAPLQERILPLASKSAVNFWPCEIT